jgi:XTP/dITP diphosphohydrolase
LKICIATRNAHKLDEIKSILKLPDLVSAEDLPGVPTVEEDGLTFKDNAIKKARTLAQFSGMWALGDDSGLMVDALDGAPGVWSARYAGENATDAQNNIKLLASLESATCRDASFCCVLALSDPEGNSRVIEGRCYGTILEAPRGKTGFGYDPLFCPNGETRSFAELGAEAKNRISHRADALRKARESWADVLPAG